ncbi:hypothetical protein [Enterococcus mundtii]|uniref:hypothetical protein n=1 Tax=Enterococcus mundtii TaxID=53346 RepID=UPI001159AE73|nr:hypothetical protein [Enterococcus mundtii]
MFTFYWLYQKNDNWLALFKTDEKLITATDKESLLKALSSVHYLVSYDNYKTSDKFLAKIISDGKSAFLQKHLSIDLSQEARSCTIEEIGFNLRMPIRAKSIEEFCMQRIAICEAIFEEREEYLETKFEIVKEFKLKPRSVMKTRANLAAEILEAKKMPKRPTVLMFDFDRYVPFFELPERLTSFYQSLKKKYMNTQEEKLKQEKFKMTLANLTHTFGVGGVHAAKEKYRGKGHYLLIDVKQFFPSIIQNNSLLSTGIQKPERFSELYNKKVETEKITYKTLINAVNGSMNNPYSPMYDPQKFYSVTVNGQLIITHLIKVLENFFEELIQTNTDGILIRINPICELIIRELLALWCNQLHLQVSITTISHVWQRDVNNYVFQRSDGKLIRKGVFAKRTYLSNNVPVISEGIFESVVKGIKPQSFLIDRYKHGSIEDFYFVGKLQGDFTTIEQQTINGYKRLNNTICGIATTNQLYGGVYQVKNSLHSKLPGSPQKFLTYDKATKKEIDTVWYVEQIEKNCF